MDAPAEGPLGILRLCRPVGKQSVDVDWIELKAAGRPKRREFWSSQRHDGRAWCFHLNETHPPSQRHADTLEAKAGRENSGATSQNKIEKSCCVRAHQRRIRVNLRTLRTLRRRTHGNVAGRETVKLL